MSHFRFPQAKALVSYLLVIVCLVSVVRVAIKGYVVIEIGSWFFYFLICPLLVATVVYRQRFKRKLLLDWRFETCATLLFNFALFYFSNLDEMKPMININVELVCLNLLVSVFFGEFLGRIKKNPVV